MQHGSACVVRVRFSSSRNKFVQLLIRSRNSSGWFLRSVVNIFFHIILYRSRYIRTKKEWGLVSNCISWYWEYSIWLQRNSAPFKRASNEASANGHKSVRICMVNGYVYDWCLLSLSVYLIGSEKIIKHPTQSTNSLRFFAGSGGGWGSERELENWLTRFTWKMAVKWK